MKSKISIVVVSIIFFVVIGWIYVRYSDFSPPSEKNKIFLEKIERLESKIDSIKDRKDTIRTVIDSTHVKIITNEKHYKEVVNTIISQPTSADYEYIANYILLRQSANKGDSTNLR